MSIKTNLNHIGFIVDGNRRWAKERGLSSYDGHLEGYKVLKDLTKKSFECGIKYVSAYVFSTENWSRDTDEVSKLMGLVMKLLSTDMSLFTDNDIKLKIIGSKDNLSEDIIRAIKQAEDVTKNNKSGTLVLCFNYGGKLEIIDSIKNLIRKGCDINQLDEKMIDENIYAPEIPTLDMIVRTSGEKRLSNFMLWRSAYSEIMFIDKKWPDMTVDDINVIIDEYNNRSRRFGR